MPGKFIVADRFVSKNAGLLDHGRIYVHDRPAVWRHQAGEILIWNRRLGTWIIDGRGAVGEVSFQLCQRRQCLARRTGEMVYPLPLLAGEEEEFAPLEAADGDW